MEIRIESNSKLNRLSTKLHSMRRDIPNRGRQWARESADYFHQTAHETLSHQGRPGGTSPPLSPMTWRIYSIDGEPDGSGVRNHMRVVEKNMPDGYQATFGILDGEPSQIAWMQNYGTTYTVTPQMRDFFAGRYGIHLSPNTTAIHVPGRCFLDIASEKTQRHAKERFERLFSDLKKRP